MRFLNSAILVIMLLFLVSCTGQESNEIREDQTWVDFKSEKYSFSFSFPGSWNEITGDLPDRWAIVNNGDTILFTVNKAQIEDLLVLGKIQALRDIYPEAAGNKIKQEKVDEVNNMVKLAVFNNKTWYTYAIKFQDKDVDSIVSGTLC